jgi:hypothetical protein
MKTFRADLHIHTLLSPCGDLDMTPANIIAMAKLRRLDILAITDHNCTKQAPLIRDMGQQEGIFVICGAEITTREEIHCLVFMPDDNKLSQLQDYIDAYLPPFANDPDRFGYQVAINAKEEIVYEAPYLLINGIDQSIDEVAAFVHKSGGLFIPAHVNRSKYSVISQLGFIPPDLEADALEISRHYVPDDLYKQFKYVKKWTLIRDSDAHFPKDIGRVYNEFYMENASFAEFEMALKGQNGRKVIPNLDDLNNQTTIPRPSIQ